MFAIEDHGATHVLRVPVDGGDAEVVVGGTRVVTGYDLAGGTLAFTAGSPTALPELHVLVGGQERQLTALNAAFHADVPPAEPEHFRVPSPAGDGDIDAWLIRPHEPVDPASVPLLVSIHGGPMTQYGNTWFDEFQLWAGAGYAVVYCNPHGSSGHTDAFAQAIRPPEAEVLPGTGWGGIDADDVLAVLDAVLEREPVLDRDRVGVLGGSYGGYLTSWLIGHSDRFAAACSERAVNNMESEEWSSDAAGWFRWELGVSHVEAPEVYRRISPVTYARDITTPLLIIHSENDLRCHVEQADAMFVALRQLGREVEYWRFPEEGHELSRSGSPRHRVQRAELILDWFGRHLGGRRPTISWDHPSRAE
ncbi:alpha/beta hydrolase family protein [Pseudonocardia sp. CA-107938]|uniref:alpha/beta hydrolase family protein n=1 Tax=Pseudonocardia sp. CA-107938 TaxID=3240021 RepID=UPI003D90D8B5